MPALFLIGAAFGTALDWLHVTAGAERYAHPSFGGLAWWVPPEFGLLYALGVGAVTLVGDPAPRRGSVLAASGEALWLSALYAITAFFHDSPWAVAAVLGAALAARAPTLRVLVAANPIPAAGIVALGPLGEASLIAAGVFSYAEPQLGSIPVWLPLLWASAVPFAIRLTEAALLLGGVRVRPATQAG
jgi:hypothetical protein